MSGGAGAVVLRQDRDVERRSLDEPRKSPTIGVQVIALTLAALLPVAWLVGRRTAPEERIAPLLVAAANEAIELRESPRGLATQGGAPSLPVMADRGGVYRLRFVLTPREEDPRPPYRLRLEGPDGRDIWQRTWAGMEGERPSLELVVPVASLRPGKYALRVEDAAGIVRSYPFLVPAVP